MTKVGVSAITDKNNLVWLYHRLNSEKYELYFGFNGSGEHSTRVNFTDYYNWHKAIIDKCMGILTIFHSRINSDLHNHKSSIFSKQQTME